jgi:arginase
LRSSASTTRPGSRPWAASARSAVHFDVDTIDSNEIVFGLGAEPGCLTGVQARRIVADLDAAVDVVAFTVAEFIPRQVISLQQLLTGFPLISGR